MSKANKSYTYFLYNRLQRRGFLYRDCQRLVNQNRNVLAACMMMHGQADAMVTGQTRSYAVCFDDVRHVLDPRPDAQLFGISIVVARGRTVFMADTAVHDRPDAVQLAHIAEQSAAEARAMGHEPRVAFVSYSNFGNPPGAPTTALREAYPFIRLSGPANILVMAGLHAASSASKMLQKLGGATIIGPLLMGLERSAQIVSMGASVSDLVNHAALAAYEAIVSPTKKLRPRKK